ncbi:MAG TPA: plastocyanin/azurin family copper-binding protein [Acidimicrobiales bacterium]|nr:plastocyanin/azurin family copper-binding protein [Acidimicrobiales bacterium]
MRPLAGLLVISALILSGCSAGPSTRTVELTVHHSKFSLTELRVRPGETVRFVLRNTDPIPHELIVGDQSVQDAHEAGTEAHHADRPGEVSVAPRATAVTRYRFRSEEGRLLFGCHLPGHWAYGMKGTIVVG